MIYYDLSNKFTDQDKLSLLQICLSIPPEKAFLMIGTEYVKSRE
jgi:hypothetical protein